ncbi:enoyl-CoA hydratase [Bacillus massilinigeriensis]|uniref:enoyl-CoA hydratase n=1 Tax=Bacillus massilionigeriensis TaxID=1805475 RepID=UPI00096B2F63|nr:enoyl-CoA hydratase [Bacillus massilionigeriensis]
MNTESPTSTVNVVVQGRVARVEMNRPESLNALDQQMIKELGVKLKEISTNDDIDIVVLTGSGRAFSSGGDIKSMLSEGDESDFAPIMESLSDLVVTLYCLPKLTISAIKGAAAGLGLSLALATDYILADKNSKLAMNFIGIGLIPDGGAHFFLDKMLGEDQAKHLIWEGKVQTADEAKLKGVVHEVAEDGLENALNRKLDEWLNQPVQAMIRTKKILAENNRPDLLKILELEKYGQLKMRQTQDHAEGIAAFLEKRKPNFIGK